MPALIRVWEDQALSKGYKQSLVFALGSTRDERAIEVLVNMLGGADSTFRRRAAWALGEFGTEQVLPILTKYEDDQDERVRQNVAEAIKKLKGELERLFE